MKSKWFFVIGVVLLLTFCSMLLSGIFSIMYGSYSGSSYEDSEGNVAHIAIKGPIYTEASQSVFDQNAVTSSKTVVRQLKDIAEDDEIKGVIIEINSPGGSGVAADEISQAIKELNKTSVAYVREVGASAAYWIASSTDQIYANRMSTVGSIGVIASYLDFSEFLTEYNVSYERFVAGKHKDFGSPFREVSEEERALFQQKMDLMHDIFISEVAVNRNLSEEHVRDLATGMIYLGIEGVNLGLIDGFGGEEEALEYIEAKENITADLKYYKKEVTLADLFSLETFGYAIGKGFGSTFDSKDGFFKLETR